MLKYKKIITFKNDYFKSEIIIKKQINQNI